MRYMTSETTQTDVWRLDLMTEIAGRTFNGKAITLAHIKGREIMIDYRN